MAAPNIVNVSSIYGKTFTAQLTTSSTSNHLVCPSNKVLKVNTILIANEHTANITVEAKFYDASAFTSRTFASDVNVPVESTLVLISKDTALYLEEGDAIRCGASVTAVSNIIISYEEIDDA